MFQYPVLFPAVSNRESWPQVVQIADDETGDLISLTDGSGNPLYAIYLEISPSRPHGAVNNYTATPYYDDCGEPIIFASLSDYLSIIGTGTIQIQVPYTIMQKLTGGRTYDVYMRIEDVANNDARQLLVGKLPVAFGGRGP